MTERQLINMQQLLKGGKLTNEELEDLKTIIDIELYSTRIQDFAQYVTKTMPDTPDDSPDSTEALDKFYDMDWHISFGDRTVCIHNGATVYNGICDMLTDVINNDL